jgi:hypothetical protein
MRCVRAAGGLQGRGGEGRCQRAGSGDVVLQQEEWGFENGRLVDDGRRGGCYLLGRPRRRRRRGSIPGCAAVHYKTLLG